MGGLSALKKLFCSPTSLPWVRMLLESTKDRVQAGDSFSGITRQRGANPQHSAGCSSRARGIQHPQTSALSAAFIVLSAFSPLPGIFLSMPSYQQKNMSWSFYQNYHCRHSLDNHQPGWIEENRQQRRTRVSLIIFVSCWQKMWQLISLTFLYLILIMYIIIIF